MHLVQTTLMKKKIRTKKNDYENKKSKKKKLSKTWDDTHHTDNIHNLISDKLVYKIATL